jgi:hypothetical protein
MIPNQHVKFSKSWNPRIQLGLLERVGGSQKHEHYYSIFSYTHAHVSESDSKSLNPNFKERKQKTLLKGELHTLLYTT